MMLESREDGGGDRVLEARSKRPATTARTAMQRHLRR